MKKKNKKLLLTTALCSALVCVGLGCYASLDGVSIASAETTITGEVTATGFTMELGASVKYVGNNGLRFTAKLPKELYQTGNTYGMLIAPQEYVEAQPFTYENLFGENAVYDWENEDGSYTASTKTRIINITYNTLEQLNDDYYTIKGSISNIKDENLSRNFVGLAYVRTPDGYALASYANDNVANNARSIVSVSLAAIDSNEISEDVKATLQTNYIDKAFTPVTYTTTEGYTQFISNDTSDYSNSYFSSSSANTSTLPNGYTTGYTVSAGYGEQYKIFQNFDWNNYSQLKFAFKRANEDSYLNFVGKVYKKEGSSELEKSLDWVEITVKKQANGKWLISHNKEYGEEIATLQDKTIGLSGNFEITELLGIKVNATRYQTVTYLDEEGNLFTTEKVKEGEAAQATTTPTKNDWNENGYNLSYTFSKWTDAEGNPADLSNITAPVTVYASGEIYKSKSYVTDLSKADDRGWVLHQSLTETHGDIAKKDGTVEFYVCAQYNNTLVQIMDNTHWTGTGTTIDAGKWYRFTIIYDKEGKPTEAHLYNENGEIVHTPNAGNSLEGYQVNNLWIYAKTLNSDWSATIETGTIQITTVETVKYVPTYTVTYHDEEGNVLSTEKVKKNSAATYSPNKTEGGYTYEYKDLSWLTEVGDEVGLDKITSDLHVYLSAEKWIYKTIEKGDGSSPFPKVVDLNEYVKVDANGNMTFKLRIRSDSSWVSFNLYDKTGWTSSGDSGFGGSFANQWFTIVVNGETKALNVYDASGNKMENSRTMTDYTAGSLSVVCKAGDFDIAAVETVSYKPTNACTITYYDAYGEELATERVKEGNAAKYVFAKDGYVIRQQKWTTKDGKVVDLSNVTSDISVYFCGGYFLETNVTSSTTGLLSSLNEAIRPSANGDLTFKIRLADTTNTSGWGGCFKLIGAQDKHSYVDMYYGETLIVWLNKEKNTISVYKESTFAPSDNIENRDLPSEWTTFDGLNLYVSAPVVLEKYVATENADIDLCGVSAIVYDELSTADTNYGYAEMKYAAEELQYFLEQITGTRIPVRSASDKNDLLASERYILLGSGLAESFDCYAASELTQGTDYKLYRSGNNVYIYGTEKYGTLNGVYGFLNKYAGLEFFSDGVYSYGSGVELGKEDIFVSTLEEKNANSFEYAWAVDGMLASPLENKPDTFVGDNWISGWHNWGYQRRLGYINMSPLMGGGWHNIATLVDKTQYSEYITQITDINENKTDTVLLAKDDFKMAGVVADKLYAMHTDTTAWGQGKDYNPGRRMYTVSMPDATERPNYTEGNALFNTYSTYAAEYTLFINKVAEAFNEKYNGDDGVIHIVLLAYNNTLEAPQAQSGDNADKFKLYSSNKVKVSVMFAPVEMNLYRPLDDNEHTLYQTEKTNKYYADELVKWKELLGDGGELYFWNYSTYFDNYFTPLDTVNAMQGTYKFLKEQGVTAIYDQGQLNSANSTDWTALKIYLKSCLIKDVDTVLWTDEATMIGGAVEKFFRAYYGGAWETMLDLYATERDWLATLATNSMKEGKEMIGIGHLFRTKTGTIFTHDIFDKKYWDDSPSDGNFGTKNYDSSMLEGWYSKITEALSKTTDKTIKARINVEGLTIRYLLAKVYSNTTNGTMSQIAEDAKALGVTKFNEGVNVDSLS